MEDARLTLHFNNNLSVHDVIQASQSNYVNAGDNSQINEAFTLRERILFEEKFAEYNELHRKVTSDGVRSRMLQEFDREITMLRREELRDREVLDPPEMSGPRTHGKGGFGKKGGRRLTAAELMEKQLKKDERYAAQKVRRAQEAQRIQQKSTSTSAIPVCESYQHTHNSTSFHHIFETRYNVIFTIRTSHSKLQYSSQNSHNYSQKRIFN